MEWKKYLVPFILFVLVLVIRLFLAFSTHDFTYDSYSTLRQAENIQHTGIPLYQDPLSYAGRLFLFPPLYEYLVAIFGFVLTFPLAAKFLPNLFYALLAPIAYELTKRYTNHIPSSLLAGIFIASFPVMGLSLFSSNSLSLAVFLFLSILMGMTMLDNKSITYVLLAMVALVLTSPISMLLAATLLIYLLLSKFEGFTPNKKETELVLFLTFLALWSTIILYKKSLFIHGLGILSQNIPTAFKGDFFTTVSFLEAFLFVGIVVLALGIYGAYLVIKQKESKQLLLFVSMLLVFFAALLLQIIPLLTGLLFVGVPLSVLSGKAIHSLHNQLKTFKLKIVLPAFYVLVIIFLVAFTFVPAANLVQDTSDVATATDVQSMLWIGKITRENSTILTYYKEGPLLNYVAKRSSVMDPNFLNIPLIEQRQKDMDTILTSNFQTTTIPLLRYYKIDYIYVSPLLAKQYSKTLPSYDETCFEKINHPTIELYEVIC